MRGTNILGECVCVWEGVGVCVRGALSALRRSAHDPLLIQNQTAELQSAQRVCKAHSTVRDKTFIFLRHARQRDPIKVAIVIAEGLHLVVHTMLTTYTLQQRPCRTHACGIE